MARIDNLRKPNVFVLDPATELQTAGSYKPSNLPKFHVGIFDPETGVGAGAAPSSADVPSIIIHQNLGDNKFGTVHTPIIEAKNVIKWYGKASHVPVPQITYFGYDESDNTKDIRVYPGQELVVPITVYNEELNRWYGPNGYTVRVTLNLSLCNPCASDCTILDQDQVADQLVSIINGTDAPSGGFPTTIDLKNYVTASKVTTGTPGEADYRVGIKLVGKLLDKDTINDCNPQQFWRSKMITFKVGVPLNCPNVKVTYQQAAKEGNGFPVEVVELEAESQGYDRVRDTFEYTKFMQKNYIIRAADGTYYDLYYLSYEREHRSSVITGPVRDPYIAIFAVPHGQGGALEDFFNAWLEPLGFDAVSITADGSDS